MGGERRRRTEEEPGDRSRVWLGTEAGEEGVEAYEWSARRVGEVVRIGVRSVRLRVGLGRFIRSSGGGRRTEDTA